MAFLTLLLSRRDQVIKFNYLPWKMDLTLKEMSFCVQNRSFRPKIDPLVNFSHFQVKKIFHFQNVLDVSMGKEQQQPPWLINFTETLVGYAFIRINTKSHKVWAS